LVFAVAAAGVGVDELAVVAVVVTEEELLAKSLNEMLLLALVVVSLRTAEWGDPSWVPLLRKEWWWWC